MPAPTVLLGGLLVVALRRGMRPWNEATEQIARRSAHSLEPIASDHMPREMQPLVRAFNELMLRSSNAFSMQRRFVADAAHELRSPIIALRLQLNLLATARGIERFRRGSGAHVRKGDPAGSGPGLAIVQAIAARHSAVVTLGSGHYGSGLEVGVVFEWPAGSVVSRGPATRPRPAPASRAGTVRAAPAAR